jgi:hypothetical protein
MFKSITKKEIVVKDVLGEPALTLLQWWKEALVSLLNISGGPGIRDSLLNPNTILAPFHVQQ